MIKIPVLNTPNQSFNIAIEGEQYTFKIRHAYRTDSFYMLMYKDNENLVSGIKMVSGINLLGAFNLLKGGLFVINSAENNFDPNMGSWDISTELFYFTEEELQATL